MTKQLRMRAYIDQIERWPPRGRILLAQFDEETVVVYQAYNPTIARHAVEHGAPGGPGFSLERMSWIKPGFLWMMHRSGWATKPDQQHVLAIWLRRSAFDEILANAVHTTYIEERYLGKDRWQEALEAIDARLQWDPDHDPQGRKLERRAIQLGLRGEMLQRFTTEWIVQIEDITPLVHQLAEYRDAPEFLLTPVEKPYPVHNRALAIHLGLDKSGE